MQESLDGQQRLDAELDHREEGRSPRLGGWAHSVSELRGKRYVDLAKDTQFTDAWIILGILLTLVGLASRIPFLFAAAVCLFVIPAVGWAWNAVSFFGLDYRRHLSETRAFLGETVTLTLETRNRKFLPVPWLQVIDIFPTTLPLRAASGERLSGQVRVNASTNLGEFASFWSLGAFGRLTRTFTIECAARGFHAFGPAALASGDAFGMFARRGKLSEQQRLIVYPRLYKAADLGLPAKNPFGERAAIARLTEDPLRSAGIRAWQPHDGLSRVHWKATARHRDLLSRVYEPTDEPQVLLFLNVATLERHWLGQIPELMERTISVAGSLAALCADLRLPVGLIANGVLPGSDQPLRLLPGRSPDQIVHILELLAAVTAFASAPVELLLMQEAPRLPWGATLVVVTAVAHDGLLASLVDLTRAGRRVVLFTLAEKPPAVLPASVTVYHLPHLVDDLIAPVRLTT